MGFTAPWPASIGVEYRRADSYAYMRRYYSEVYHQFGRPWARSSARTRTWCARRPRYGRPGRVRFAGGVGRWNRGALRLTQRPAQAAFGHAGEPYPSVSEDRPAVQEAWLGDASVEWLDTTAAGAADGRAGEHRQREQSARRVREFSASASCCELSFSVSVRWCWPGRCSPRWPSRRTLCASPFRPSIRRRRKAVSSVASAFFVPGDGLKIAVWGEKDLSGEYLIDARGLVQIPGLGDIVVAGLTPMEVKARLSEQLVRRGIVAPEISVQPVIRVSVLGRGPEPGVALGGAGHQPHSPDHAGGWAQPSART